MIVLVLVMKDPLLFLNSLGKFPDKGIPPKTREAEIARSLPPPIPFVQQSGWCGTGVLNRDI